MWRSQKVAYLATVGGVLQVIGWHHVRHCGCAGSVGMRLDRREPTFGVAACEQHGAEVARALDALKNMPPQDEEIASLFKRLLEHELADPTSQRAFSGS